ncbi:hypothetical protein AB0H76_04555 [Nocardia sp. NPDC050712]|uniref:TRADD-N-associated membrane domain-containing protein n=1 Tax=Nocardia sp. NPDC050712 TaxID=3155518 RepID=UPI0033FD5806
MDAVVSTGRLPRSSLVAFFEGNTLRLPSRMFFEGVLEGLEMPTELVLSWQNAYVILEQRFIQPTQQVIVTGNNANVEVNSSQTAPGADSRHLELGIQRQKFYFRFLQQALSQAETTFRFSVIFTIASALVLLAGAILTLIHADDESIQYPAIVTGLSGLLITTCGGAFAVRASRARDHLTRQADVIYEDIQSDHAMERANALINDVNDIELRDRLKSITAIQAMGLSPQPINLEKHLPIKNPSGRQK